MILRRVLSLTERQEHEILSFPLLLIPQRTGHLLYPSVDITLPSRRDGSNPAGAQGGGPRQALHTSEVDYRNQGDALLVVSDLASSTASISFDEAAPSAWLVESRYTSGK